MRMMFGIAISVAATVIFCAAYLTALALEVWRDANRSHQVAEHEPLGRLQVEVWAGPSRIAA